MQARRRGKPTGRPWNLSPDLLVYAGNNPEEVT
jgi:hypothetical protein